MTLFIVFYYLNLLLFLFLKNVVGYCLLLICNALYVIAIIYISSGFSWYAILVYLIYVGGVYILFIFLSVHLPNISNVSYVNFNILIVFLFFFWELFQLFYYNHIVWFEYSFNFCSLNEGAIYVFLCCFLLICFFLVSLINSSKESFLR
uniref:NADH dehydrogenase subunit 6 n=1 Tax=Thaparocleidus varicus TaxID=341076 RepID=A0A7L8ZR95_9PLAT|nr:NADH dehydrogenase subunit 6 [Thaparocleidus varicus]QOI72758.1 NADH dehydrogenase subunit 6 [Thaparocleidus varicus]